MSNCACTLDNHLHTGTCGKDGFSLSTEHDSEWLCKGCYDVFIQAKKAVIDFHQSLITLAQQDPDKLNQAKKAIAHIMAGGK